MTARRNTMPGKQPKPLKKGLVAKRRGGVTRSPVLSAHALAWRRLLVDPCNAPPAAPCYGGTQGGFLTRVKYVFPVLNMTDYLIQYTPSLGPLAGGLVLGGTMTAGGGFTPTAVSGSTFNAFLNTNARAWRTAAACMKIRYTGAEGNRSGYVTSRLTPRPPYQAGTSTNTSLEAGMATTINRFGEVQHELKFVPTDYDTLWNDVNSSATNNPGCAMIMSLNGIYTTGATAVVEITTVYEWQPLSALGTGSVMAPPPSSNSYSDVLRSLGDTLRWAYGEIAAPILQSIATTRVRQNYNLGWRDEF